MSRVKPANEWPDVARRVRTPVSDIDRPAEMAQRFAHVARSLVREETVASTLQQIAVTAVEVVGCTHAAVVGLPPSGGAPRLLASTDATLMKRLAQIAAAAGDGPGWEAIRDVSTVSSDDLTRESRWSSYPADVVAQSRVRSLVASCLCDGDEALGAMMLYAEQPQAFDAGAMDRAAVYADHAALALRYAGHAERARHLAAALDSNRQIGVALGILVERHRLSTDQAFALLRRASQLTHRKLHDIADDLVTTGALPEVGGTPADDRHQ